MNSFNFDYDADDPAMATFDADLQNWLETTYGNGSQGIPGQGTTTSPMLGAQGPQGNTTSTRTSKSFKTY